MNDAFGVSRVQSVGNLNGQTEQSFRLNRLSGDALFQRHAVQKLHGDEWLTILLPDFMDRADIRMVQGGRRLSLSLEAGQRL